MNPYLIAFKFFILMSTAQVVEQHGAVEMGDFVVNKLTTYQPQLHSGSFHKQLPDTHQNSVLHEHQLLNRQKLAIFCKMEHELAKASGFAVKFRLGDQSFVDQLEGK